MGKLKNIFTNWRILLLIIIMVFSLISISPHPLRDGVSIRAVDLNSSASIAGLEPPKPTDQPVTRERILAINEQQISSLEDYHVATADLGVNATVYVRTNKATYGLRTREAFEKNELNETEFIVVEEFERLNVTDENGTTTEITRIINVTKEVPRIELISLGTQDLGLDVYQSPRSNVRKGLDLQGGTRVLLQPEEPLSPEDLESLIESMTQRLNVYGLSDLTVKEAGDLSGNQFILVEIAGASESEIRELLAQQGKFEAKIDGTTVFSGGDDITFVCRSANCAGIDPVRGCFASGPEQVCAFTFSITLSKEAADRQAAATANLEVINEGQGAYLSSPLELILDDVKVDELNIGEGLRGTPTTNIQISGSGAGPSVDLAAYNALQNMKQLQTVLITGSLPVQLDIVKVDSISPTLGAGFVANSILMALVVIIAVALLVAFRYRKAVVAVPIFVTMVSELIIILGVASLIRWNVDLAAIAGIIAAIGTGVDHQIVITDETLRGQSSSFRWKERVKRAFLIITLAYATVFAAMFPLIFAGAGLLKGFALITIIGATIGVLITRPAYSAMLEILLK